MKIQASEIELVSIDSLIPHPKNNNAKVFKPLSGVNGRGKVVIVDFDDYVRLGLSSKKVSLNNGYARLGKKYLHRLITNEAWQIVDHVDRNPLNNTKANLRESCYAKNLANTVHPKDKLKGVYLQPGGNFRAAIITNGKYVTLGTYGTDAEAFAAYNAACILIYGGHYRGRE